jgi:hypothetical protein
MATGRRDERARRTNGLLAAWVPTGLLLIRAISDEIVRLVILRRTRNLVAPSQLRRKRDLGDSPSQRVNLPHLGDEGHPKANPKKVRGSVAL